MPSLGVIATISTLTVTMLHTPGARAWTDTWEKAVWWIVLFKDRLTIGQTGQMLGDWRLNIRTLPTAFSCF